MDRRARSRRLPIRARGSPPRSRRGCGLGTRGAACRPGAAGVRARRMGLSAADVALRPRALVPRPETETLVERCIELLRDSAGGGEPRSPRRVLDVGTGTGAIALALADEVENVQVVAIDASADALALARENTEHLGLDVELVHARLGGRAAAGAVRPDRVEPAVRPGFRTRGARARGARLGAARGAAGRGPDGATRARGDRSAATRRRRSSSRSHEEHGERVSDLLESLGYDDVRITRDLAGRDRVVEGKRP